MDTSYYENRIEELEESLQEWVGDFWSMKRPLNKVEKQNRRLISRGFEDLHFENEQLKEDVKRLETAIENWEIHSNALIDRLDELEAERDDWKSLYEKLVDDTVPLLRISKAKCKWSYVPPDQFNGIKFGNYFDTQCGHTVSGTANYCPHCGGEVY